MLTWLQRKTTTIHQVVQDFNQAPRPQSNSLIENCPLLVLDLELTGLDPKRDHIVSIGWLPVRRQEIILAEASHYLINSPISVGQSAVYHGLHDYQLQHGHDLAEVLTELLSRYAGYTFVAHHSALEMGFLRTACLRCFGKAPQLRFIDTMQIEWHRLLQQGEVITHDALKLDNCLKRHHLPIMQHHHALEDAYSCAMLLLSQLKLGGSTLTLNDLYQQSR